MHSVFRLMIIVCGIWVICTQVCSIFARGSVDIVSVLTILGAAAFAVVGLLRRELKIARIALLAVCVSSFVAAWIVYANWTANWTEAYASSATLHQYGADPFSLEDQKIIQEKLSTGQIDWLEMQQTLLKNQENPPSKIELNTFKLKRFLRQTFWPPLQYQFWKKTTVADSVNLRILRQIDTIT